MLRITYQKAALADAMTTSPPRNSFKETFFKLESLITAFKFKSSSDVGDLLFGARSVLNRSETSAVANFVLMRKNVAREVLARERRR